MGEADNVLIHDVDVLSSKCRKQLADLTQGKTDSDMRTGEESLIRVMGAGICVTDFNDIFDLNSHFLFFSLKTS